jgi:hypothetical protein
MFKAWFEFFLVASLSMATLMFAPAILSGLGAALVITGKLAGLISRGSPVIFTFLTISISFLLGLRAFLSKYP